MRAKSPRRTALQAYEAFLAPALVLFILGNALAYALPGWPLGVPALAGPALLLLLGLGLASDRPWVLRGSLWLMCLTVGSLSYAGRHFEPGPTDPARLGPRQAASIQAMVEEQKPDRNQAVVRVTRVDGQAVAGRALLYEPPALKGRLLPGDRLELTATLALPQVASLPGSFDERRHLRTLHIATVLRHAERIRVLKPEPMTLWHRLLRHTAGLRAHITQVFREALPSPQAEVLGGLVLGDRAVPVDRDTKQAFVETGLVHLLAASGMNVGIIAATVFWLLQCLRLPFRVRLGLALGAVGFYSLLTGMPPSIQRAASMLGLALGLKLVRRELSPLLLLCVAAAFLVALNPDNIASIGFQFSVLTTFGLITMVPPLQERFERPIARTLAGLVLVPLVAQLWIWPLSVAYFNQMPLHAIPLNIAALPMVTGLTVLGFSAALLSLIAAPLALLPLWLSQPLLNALLWLVQAGHGMDWAKATAASPEGWLIAALYATLACWLWLLYKAPPMRAGLRGALAVLPLLLLVGTCWARDSLALGQGRLDVLPLSHARRAFLLKPPGTHQTVALVPAHIRYWEGRRLADYLKHRHLTTLEALVLLPDEATAPAGDEGLAPLRRQASVGRTVSLAPTPPPAMAETLNPAVPLRHGRIRLGGLVLEADADTLRAQWQGHCLLQSAPRYQGGSPCRLQQVTFPENRLLGTLETTEGQTARSILFHGEP